MPITLQLVSTAQQKLRAVGVTSIVTGDFGFNYHGVDVVAHDIELCVPRSQIYSATTVLNEQPELYRRLPDLDTPDFYHPCKQDAVRFKILDADEPFELYIVADKMLGLELGPGIIESGLTASRAHPELKGFCVGVSDTILYDITWPKLAAFIRGWLSLASVHFSSEVYIVYMMQAERLIYANDVDDAWCEICIQPDSCVRLAKSLLKGKDNPANTMQLGLIME